MSTYAAHLMDVKRVLAINGHLNKWSIATFSGISSRRKRSWNKWGEVNYTKIKVWRHETELQSYIKSEPPVSPLRERSSKEQCNLPNLDTLAAILPLMEPSPPLSAGLK